MEAALAGALGVSANTILLVYGVTSYNDEFVDVSSCAWSLYAALALLTYLMAMAMSIAKVDDLAYIVLGSSVLSSAFLCAWLIQKRKPPHEPSPDEIELLRMDKNDAEETT